MHLSFLKSILIGAAYLVAILSSALGSVFRGVPLLLISLLAYHHLPNALGITPFTVIQLISFFSDNHEVWIGLLGLIVAIVAARSFMDSKRLDMRLAAVGDIQGLTERATTAISHCGLLAEALVALEDTTSSKEWTAATIEDQDAYIQDNLIKLHVCYSRGLKARDDAWTLLLESISMAQKHRLVLLSSAIAFVGMKKAQKTLDEFAALSSFPVPSQAENVDHVVNWVVRADLTGCRTYLSSHRRLLEQVATRLGSASGVIGHGIFSPSAIALVADLWELRRATQDN